MNQSTTITAKSQADQLNKWHITNYNPNCYPEATSIVVNKEFKEDDFGNSKAIDSPQFSETVAETKEVLS